MSLAVIENSLLLSSNQPHKGMESFTYWHKSSFDPNYTVYADSLDEIADYISSNTFEDDEVMRIANRVRMCSKLIIPLRRRVSWNMHLDGVTLDGWEKRVYQEVVKQGIHVAYGWGSGDQPVLCNHDSRKASIERDIWNSKVPLVLLDVNYDSYTNSSTHRSDNAIMEPLSTLGSGLYIDNLWVIRTRSNEEMMKSLANSGAISYGFVADIALDSDDTNCHDLTAC